MPALPGQERQDQADSVLLRSCRTEAGAGARLRPGVHQARCAPGPAQAHLENQEVCWAAY